MNKNFGCLDVAQSAREVFAFLAHKTGEIDNIKKMLPAELHIWSIRKQCKAADVAFHFKQWDGTNKKLSGRVLDGKTWDEFPGSGLDITFLRPLTHIFAYLVEYDGELIAVHSGDIADRISSKTPVLR